MPGREAGLDGKRAYQFIRPRTSVKHEILRHIRSRNNLSDVGNESAESYPRARQSFRKSKDSTRDRGSKSAESQNPVQDNSSGTKEQSGDLKKDHWRSPEGRPRTSRETPKRTNSVKLETSSSPPFGSVRNTRTRTSFENEHYSSRNYSVNSSYNQESPRYEDINKSGSDSRTKSESESAVYDRKCPPGRYDLQNSGHQDEKKLGNRAQYEGNADGLRGRTNPTRQNSCEARIKTVPNKDLPRRSSSTSRDRYADKEENGFNHKFRSWASAKILDDQEYPGFKTSPFSPDYDLSRSRASVGGDSSFSEPYATFDKDFDPEVYRYSFVSDNCNDADPYYRHRTSSKDLRTSASFCYGSSDSCPRSFQAYSQEHEHDSYATLNRHSLQDESRSSYTSVTYEVEQYHRNRSHAAHKSPRASLNQDLPSESYRTASSQSYRKRCPRKLTKDSGYETTYGEPDYANCADWTRAKKINPESRHSLSSVSSYAESWSCALVSRCQSQVLRSSCLEEQEQVQDPSPFCCCPDCLSPDDEVFVGPDRVQGAPRRGDSAADVRTARSAPALQQLSDLDMVTRRFRKGSVYEALASKSGFDFAPVVGGRPYWELTPSGDLVLLQQPHGKVATKDLKATPQPMGSSSPPSSPSRDSAPGVKGSPPPPAPRDHQGGHEKFPSWPHLSPNDGNGGGGVQDDQRSPPGGSSPYKDSMTSGGHGSGSPVSCNPSRSRSWTEATDYPKEKASSYVRPKETCSITPQDLQPVHENLLHTHAQNETRYYTLDQEFSEDYRLSGAPRSLPWGSTSLDPSILSKGYLRDYDVPSPPERDVPTNHDPNHRYKEFVDRLNATTLSIHTQQEQQQQQHQYTSWQSPSVQEEPQRDFRFEATPFLDRLRRDNDVACEGWAIGQSENEGNHVSWRVSQSEDGTEGSDMSSRCGPWGLPSFPTSPSSSSGQNPAAGQVEREDSLDSNGSSQETLKWHGSYGDLSNLSSCQVSSRSSLLFDSGLSTLADSNRLSPQSSSGDDLSQDGVGMGAQCPSLPPPPPPPPVRMGSRGTSSSSSGHNRRGSVARSSKVTPPQRHDSHSVLYYAGQQNRTGSTQPPPPPPQLPEREPRRKSEPPPPSGRLVTAVGRLQAEPQQPLAPSPRRHRVSDPELRAIQKQALLSFYHRQTSNSGAEPQEPPIRGNHSTPPRHSTSNNDLSSPSDSAHFYRQENRPHARHSSSHNDLSMSLDASKVVEGGHVRQSSAESKLQDMGSFGSSRLSYSSSTHSLEPSRPFKDSKPSSGARPQEPQGHDLHRRGDQHHHLHHLEHNEGVRQESDVTKPDSQLQHPYMLKAAHARIATLKWPPEMTIHAEAVGKPPDVAQRRDKIPARPAPECPTTGRGSAAGQIGSEKKVISPYAREEIIPWAALAEFQAKTTAPPDGQHGGPHQCGGRLKTCSPEAEAGVQTSQRRSPRKAQLSEVRHPDPARPAELRVITPEGVTVLGGGSPPELPPRGTSKPSPPPVPPARQRPSPPPQAATPNAAPPTQPTENTEVPGPSTEAEPTATGSACPSPELPLPPPPVLDPLVSEISPSDEPLPPPPPDLAPAVDAALASLANPHPTQKTAVYPKNSYMSYVSVRKPCRRHGYEGNYRRSQNVSPPCRELDHLTEQQRCHSPSEVDSRTSPVTCQSASPATLSHECEVSRGHVTTRTAGDHPLSEIRPPSLREVQESKPKHTAEGDTLSLNNNNINTPNNNTSVHSRSNNNISGAAQTKSQEPLTKAQLNRINSQHLTKSGEVKGRPQEVRCQQRDAYIVLPIDLGEEVKKDEEVVKPSVQPQSSHKSEQPDVTSDSSRPGRKWEGGDKASRDEELERLSRSYAERCGDQTLKNILVPGPDRVQLWDYMQDVLCRDELLSKSKDANRTNRHHVKQESREPISPNNNTNSGGVPLDNDRTVRDASDGSMKSSVSGNELPGHSAYFTTSEPKAKLLTRISQTDLLNGQTCASDSELGRRKEELITSISRKLTLLRSEQLGLQEEVSQNEKLGREVACRVEQAAKPNELQKYRLHVEETEKILNLLMSLSGRLARAQNALRALGSDADPDERQLLEAKRDKLSSQHEEARTLKESLDRRGRQVESFLRSYLSEEEFGDYLHFVAMKAKLLVDARELDEKIRLGEEQLAALERRPKPGTYDQVLRTGTSEWNRNAGATSV